ncbi:MAG: hypothetical protein WC777_04795 [Candidatus Gracilibacteria bacterium]
MRTIFIIMSSLSLLLTACGTQEQVENIKYNPVQEGSSIQMEPGGQESPMQ